MKKLFSLTLLATTSLAISQNSAKVADLKSAEISNSTTLSLLDNTAAIIVSNPECKDFSINTENLSNISFDFSLNKGKLSGLEYYGLGKSTADFKQATANKLLRPSVSGLLQRNDSTAHFAVGVSINVITIFRVNKEKMIEAYGKIKTETAALTEKADLVMRRHYPDLAVAINPDAYYKQRNKVLDSLPNGKADEFAEILRRPLLMLDIATAYNVLYPENTFKTSQPDRLGVWSTLTVSPKLEGENNYLNIYGFVRYLDDKSVYNKDTKTYDDYFKYFDFGGKVQLDFNNLSVGYEYIKRNGNGKDYRSVGMVQYKVSTDVYITGGFGKNFTADFDKDLVTLFGIRWGMNKKDQRDWAKK